MNKVKNKKIIFLNILLIFICIILAFFIYVVHYLATYHVFVAEREEFVSKDSKYKIVLEQITEGNTFPFNRYRPRIAVEKKTDREWEYKEYFEIPIFIIDTLGRDDYTITWIDGGAIIKIFNVKKEDRTYRVYWEDVF